MLVLVNANKLKIDKQQHNKGEIKSKADWPACHAIDSPKKRTNGV